MIRRLLEACQKSSAMLVACAGIAVTTHGAYAHFLQTDSSHKTVYYAESWKQGPERIVQKRIAIRLDNVNSSYEDALVDSTGTRQYMLRVDPVYVVRNSSRELRFTHEKPLGHNPDVNSWSLSLLEPDERISLLLANRDQGHVIDVKNTYASLDPIEKAGDSLKVGTHGIPISATRVIKVERFYCVIKVTGYKVSQTTIPGFEWVELEIEFTNEWKPEIHPFTGKERAIIEDDLERATRLANNVPCDAALRDLGIPSLVVEVRKLQIGEIDRQSNPHGNIFDGRQSLHKILDQYNPVQKYMVERTIEEHLRIHKTDRAITSSWDSSKRGSDIIFIGASYFQDSDKDRALTLLRQAAYRGGIKDTDFGKIKIQGRNNLTNLLKDSCQ